MRRADRLFTIVQLLRGGKYVTARRLADRLEVSERTIYRDVDELTLCGVPIEGEAGRGFRLPTSFEIPPLMFEPHEIEALVVGVRFVEAWCGPGLAASARSALARIRGAVPAAYIDKVDVSPIFAPRFAGGSSPPHFETVHHAIANLRRLTIAYQTEDGAVSERTIRPLGLYFWGKVWTLAPGASSGTTSAVSGSIGSRSRNQASRSSPSPGKRWTTSSPGCGRQERCEPKRRAARAYAAALDAQRTGCHGAMSLDARRHAAAPPQLLDQAHGPGEMRGSEPAAVAVSRCPAVEPQAATH
jgi:biotin operon repressor